MLVEADRPNTGIMQGLSLPRTSAFVQAAHARAGPAAEGRRRWLRSLAVVTLLPDILPGITVTHAERQVALLRDILRTTAETERSLLRAGFPAAVVASVHRLTRFDAGFPYLEHLAVVAGSDDLAAKRVAMAFLTWEERHAAGAPLKETPERRERRRKATEIMRRGLGY